MPISESVPERRNLVVMSMSVIAFYVGKGALADDSLTLPLVKLEFHNPHGLALIAWGVLFWFAFKYFLYSKSRFNMDVWSELSKERYCLSFYFGWVARYNRVDQQRGVDSVFFYFRLGESSNTMDSNKLVIKFVPHGPIAKNDTIDNWGDSPETNVNKNWRTKIIYLSALCVLFFKKQSLSTHLVPYFMFIVAIFLGISNSLPCFWNSFCSKFTFLMFN